MFEIELDEKLDTLKNSNIEVKIARLGAELYSLKLRHPQEGMVGLLHNDDLDKSDSAFWKSRAPFLFPIIGQLLDNKSETKTGQQIEMGGHGFARKTVFKPVDEGFDSNSAWIEYAIDHTMIAKVKYPWKFEFRIKYTLLEKSLEVSMKVVNKDESEMWYQVGWHPGFKTPIQRGKGYKSDVKLLLPNGQYTMHEVDSESFMTGKSEEKQLGGAFPYTEEGLNRTYVFDMSKVEERWASLHDPNTNITITTEFKDLPHLGVWGMADAPFICLEPWQGCDDYIKRTKFEDKFGIVSLRPNGEDQRTVLLKLDC